MKFTISRRPKSLCETCHESVMARDDQGQVAFQYCTAVFQAPVRITGNITECNAYDFRYGVGHDHQFEKSAWVMERRGGRPVGFKPPEKEKK